VCSHPCARSCFAARIQAAPFKAWLMTSSRASGETAMSRCSVQPVEGGTLLIRSAAKSWAHQGMHARNRTDGHLKRRARFRDRAFCAVVRNRETVFLRDAGRVRPPDLETMARLEIPRAPHLSTPFKKFSQPARPSIFPSRRHPHPRPPIFLSAQGPHIFPQNKIWSCWLLG
jgi:hypothetical protein